MRRGLALLALAVIGLWAAAQAPAPSPAPSPRPAPRRTSSRRPPAAPDVYALAGGDRVTGVTLSKTRRAFVVQTPYGRLTLPRDKVVRITWADGRDELLAPAGVAATPPTPTPRPPAELQVTVAGSTFWYAWDRREEIDPTLRLRLTLDGADLATYVDATLDPRDLPGATVNSFSFEPERVVVSAAEGVHAALPDARPGRVALRVRLPDPPPESGVGSELIERRLRLSYEWNAGTQALPEWREAAAAEAVIVLEPGRTALVELRQNAGRMEFSGPGRKRMKNVDTFRLDVRPAEGAP